CYRKFLLFLFSPKQYSLCMSLSLNQVNCSGVHVQNVQVCYIGIHLPWCFASPINPSSTLVSSFTSW
uniref:Highly divergent homeobox n=1 Tax=Macaca fascicularis TaxID=9541 RepID=A0A7N9C992_MACFA